MIFLFKGLKRTETLFLSSTDAVIISLQHSPKLSLIPPIISYPISFLPSYLLSFLSFCPISFLLSFLLSFTYFCFVSSSFPSLPSSSVLSCPVLPCPLFLYNRLLINIYHVVFPIKSVSFILSTPITSQRVHIATIIVIVTKRKRL